VADLIAFLNANTGALNLLFAGVVAAATVVYAWLTAKLVAETRRLRQVQTEPHIEVFYRPRDECIQTHEDRERERQEWEQRRAQARKQGVPSERAP
jgi:primosomal protein N''